MRNKLKLLICCICISFCYQSNCMGAFARAFINHIGRTLCSLKNHPVEATISTADYYRACRGAITWASKAFMRWQFGDILHDWKMKFRINCPLNASTYDKVV